MQDQLTPQQLTSTPVPAELDLDEIQGDILIGLQKNYERFVFFEIADAAAFKTALRARIAHRITSSSTVKAREFALRDHKHQGSTQVLPLIGLNLGFTKCGTAKLVPGADLKDAAFKQGVIDRAASLGDPLDAAGKPTWKPEFVSDKIDGVFLITGGTQAAVDAEAAFVSGVFGASMNVIFDETGQARPGLERGHEHFGWKDGVSQPGVNGISDPFPGQRMLDAGRFVFGYPGQANPTPLPWMNNGSFMVFRRLNQLVPEFDQFVLKSAVDLGMDPVLLGGRIVGRWKSGAPMALTPIQDDTTLAADPQQNNNFDFADDTAQRRCPYAAHIRKTNPREDFAPVVSQENAVDPRRIIRAGIPFGPEVNAAEAAAKATSQERGLMFVCYQTSIADQFEFVQISWANNEKFISPIILKKHPDGTDVNVGWDPIIGQNKAAGRARSSDEPFPNYPAGNARSTLPMPQDFVVPTGGAYFFMPSLAALENELTS